MSEAAVATPPASQPPPAADKPTIDAPVAGERAPADFMADIVGDFEAMSEGKPPPSTPRDDKGKFVKSAEKPKSTEKPAAKTQAEKPKAEETKPAEEEVQAPKDESKPTESEAPVKPVKAAELRTAYEALKKRVREELEPELKRLKSEGAGALQERLQGIEQEKARIEQENAKLEQRLAFMDYSQSKDFLTKYDQPFREAWMDAISEFKELTVKEPDGTNELDEPQFKTRPADENDLLRLANMRLSDMDAAAQQMFGASAARAINHIQNIKKLSSAKHKALTEAQTKSAEWAKQRQTEMASKSKSLAETWDAINKGLQEKFPKAFVADDTNPEDKASYARGFALADLLFMGVDALKPEQVELLPKSLRDSIKENKTLNDTQKVQLHAIARLKMANHDRQITTIKALRAENESLKKTIAEYEQSEPSADKAGKTTERQSPKDWLQEAEEELQAMDK